MKLLCIGLLLALVASSQSKNIQYANVGSRGGTILKCALNAGGGIDESAPEVKDIFEINKDKDYQDGDIIAPKTKNTLVNTARLWESTSIPVTYAPSLSLEAIGSIEYARQEYELKTCLSFIDRTTEKDYITYDTLSGCYSSVGRVRGEQTISIGNGCERIGTVEHEMMHAIGIYHEQSRTDRDHYVTIELDNVDSGKEHNFDTYSYDVVDDRRVPYDYNSVMHYSDTSFSTNGEPTIVTIDPQFQDVIGQRRSFSSGDVAKINRMYGCADPLRVTNNCNFDDEFVCGYVQETSDSADWSVHMSDSANDPAGYPATDGSSDVVGAGSYMLFDETSAATGAMYSMRYKSKFSQQCLEFSYHMRLATGSTSSLSVHVASIDSVTGDILDIGQPVTTISGNHDYDWNIERLTISAPAVYKLVFVANTDGSSNIIGLDDVSVRDKPCETAYFVIHDYSELVAVSQPGDYIYSPVMYTDDGYAFQVKVYPVGSTSSKEGYMGMYYYLAMGENDDKLQWPFSDRFIRFSVVDQNKDANLQMSQSNNFMSTATSSAWEKPTSERNSGYGYSSFMTVSDVMDTRDFVKHDAVIISVEVKDMTPWASAQASKQKQTEMMTKSVKQALNIPEADQVDATESQLTWTTAIMIVAITSASVFLLLFVAMYVIMNMHSKELHKAMLMGRSRK